MGLCLCILAYYAHVFANRVCFSPQWPWKISVFYSQNSHLWQKVVDAHANIRSCKLFRPIIFQYRGPQRQEGLCFPNYANRRCLEFPRRLYNPGKPNIIYANHWCNNHCYIQHFCYSNPTHGKVITEQNSKRK